MNRVELFFSKLKIAVTNRSLHSFLFCFFVILYYYNEVEAQCTITQPVICIAVLLFFLIGCNKLFNSIKPKFVAYNIVLTFWMIVFFFTIYLVNTIKINLTFIKTEKAVIPFIIVIVVGLLITWVLSKLKSITLLSKLSQYLNLLFMVLTLVESIKMIHFMNHRAIYQQDFYSQDLKPKFNLYILIMDGYARTDNLKKYWNYDNSRFTDFLKEKRFFIVEKSRSNYIYSEQTVGSLLLLDYLSKSKNHLYKSHQTFYNPLFSSALKMGYSCYNLGLYPISSVENNHTMEDFTVKNFYHYVALQTPLYSYYNSFNKVAAQNRVKTDLDIFDKLSDIFNKKLTKKLVLSHSMLTHYPYDKIDSTSFDKISSTFLLDSLTLSQYTQQQTPKGEVSKFCKGCYLNQVKVINGLMTKTLETNWNDISDNSVIVVMSDHGFRFMNGNPTSSTKEAYENFTAIYFPDKDYSSLNDSMTILNSVRMSVNKALGTKFNYMIDKSNLW
jgi:hypothetical protein